MSFLVEERAFLQLYAPEEVKTETAFTSHFPASAVFSVHQKQLSPQHEHWWHVFKLKMQCYHLLSAEKKKSWQLGKSGELN